MSKIKLPMEGKCRCGQVRIRVSAPPLLTMACHCTGCQRMSSSAYSLSAAFPSEAFSVTQGVPVIGGLHGEAHHYFCAYCMTWMFTRSEGLDWFVNVRPTMFDDTGWFTPYVETWTREKLSWASTPAIRSYEALPALDEYERLVKEFTAKSS